MGRPGLLLLFCAHVGLVGCLSTQGLADGDEEPDEATRASATRDAGAPRADAGPSAAAAEETDDGTAPFAAPADGDAAASATRKVYAAVLKDTAPARFGGAPSCAYEGIMKKSEVEVALDDTGRVLEAKVSSTYVERALDGCPHAAFPVTPVKYTLGAAAGIGAVTKITMKKDVTATVIPLLTIEVAKADGGQLQAELRYATDRDPAFNWKAGGAAPLVAR